MSLREPIVEGAYYEREDGQVVGPARPITEDYGHGNYWSWHIGGFAYDTVGRSHQQWSKLSLTRRVYLVPTDPRELVGALRKLSGVEDLVTELRDAEGDSAHYTRGTRDAYAEAADLVEEAMVIAPPKPPESA